jgi:hypothetical protein
VARKTALNLLELSFDQKLLRELCESDAKLKRSFGAEKAEKLKLRLADLRASPCILDLPPVSICKYDDTDPQLIIMLSENLRIVLSMNHNVVPRLSSNGIDWSKVTRLKILRIENENN